MNENAFREKILERLVERNRLESGFHEIIINSESDISFVFFLLCLKCNYLYNGSDFGDNYVI